MPTPRTGRAAPLPPDERRLAILHAVLPVVRSRGSDVTTRELAEAAGVAEGTLFRVFDDKDTLVREAVAAALDPGEFIDELGGIDLDQPIELRLREVIRIGTSRMEDLALWMALMHRLRQAGAARGLGRHEGWEQRQQTSRLLVRAQLRRILEPDEARLRHPIDAVIVMLESMLAGAAMQQADRLRHGQPARPTDQNLVVDFFLHGALLPDSTTD